MVAALTTAMLGACDEESTTMRQLRMRCPMVVEGTEVRVSDTADGVALSFVTEERHARDLRARVAHLAEMYEMHPGPNTSKMWRRVDGSREGDHHTGLERPGGGPMPAVETTVTDMAGGARLELTPTDPTEVEALREHARRHRDRMESGQCWMWRSQDPDEEQ